MFWMVVPHVAIISRLLLAGDNPHICEGLSGLSRSEQLAPCDGSQVQGETSRTWWKRIVCFFKAEPGDRQSSTASNVIGSSPWWRELFGLKYETRYKTAWMWDRGSCKARWMARYVEEYPSIESIHKEVLRMGFEELMYTIAPTMVLLLLPTFMCGLVRYASKHMWAPELDEDADYDAVIRHLK